GRGRGHRVAPVRRRAGPSRRRSQQTMARPGPPGKSRSSRVLGRRALVAAGSVPRPWRGVATRTRLSRRPSEETVTEPTARGTGVPQTTPGTTTERPALMLVLATIGFAVTFWAWALLSPLGANLREVLALTSFEQSLVVALPVIVGSL